MRTTRLAPSARVFVTAAAALLGCALAAPAFAQAPPPPPQPQPPDYQGRPRQGRPFRGLFGGVEKPDSVQTFDLFVSASGSYSDNLTPVDGPPDLVVNPWLRDAFNAGISASPSYTRRWQTGGLMASSGHSYSYFPSYSALSGAAHSATLGLNNTFGKRVSLRLGQNAAYSPFYGTGGLFLGLGAGTAGALSWNPLYDVANRRNLRLFTSAGATVDLSRRVSVSGDYGRQSVRFTDLHTSFSSQSFAGRLTAHVTRNLSVQGGLTERWGDFGTLFINGVAVKQHDIDAGIDYNRALSRTRQTTFGFSTGSTVYTTPTRTFYRLIVSGHLEREIGRSWTARADYRRGLGWFEGFPEPVFTDAATLRINGYLNDRILVSFGASYTNGSPGLSQVSASMDSYTGYARSRFALTRFLAVSAQYVYYNQRFGDGFPLPAGIPNLLKRQSVLVGVDLWVPLLR